MSENRKILVAKRHLERSKHKSVTLPQNSNQRGTKRSNPTPTKNLANERLKRLRTSLNAEAQKLNTSGNCSRKRRSDEVVEKCEVMFNNSTETFKSSDEELVSVEMMDWSSTASCSTSGFDKSETLLVVDTNVFIANLQTIKDIINLESSDDRFVIYIPWMVIEELDFIKEDSNKTKLRLKAQESIKYIESILSKKNGKMIGQTLDDVNCQKSTGCGQDNKILGSCLQLVERRKNYILLTNDMNLKNKAHLNGIPVESPLNILKKKFCSGSKFDLVVRKMISLCRGVIEECARRAYGLAALKMPILQKKITNFMDCIGVFCKYWFPVFQEVLMKQTKKAIDDLDIFLRNNTVIKDGTKELEDLVRLCVRLCIFLKDVEICKNSIEGTIRDLNDIKDS